MCVCVCLQLCSQKTLHPRELFACLCKKYVFDWTTWMLWCPGAIHTRMKKVQCKANRERVRFESEGVRATLADTHTHTHSCARTFLTFTHAMMFRWPQFRGYRQQDAQELLRVLLDTIEQEELHVSLPLVTSALLAKPSCSNRERGVGAGRRGGGYVCLLQTHPSLTSPRSTSLDLSRPLCFCLAQPSAHSGSTVEFWSDSVFRTATNRCRPFSRPSSLRWLRLFEVMMQWAVCSCPWGDVWVTRLSQLCRCVCCDDTMLFLFLSSFLLFCFCFFLQRMPSTPLALVTPFLFSPRIMQFTPAAQRHLCQTRLEGASPPQWFAKSATR